MCKKLLLIAGILTILSGCASISKGTNQSLSIETSPVTNATCTLDNDKGSWFVNKTPGSVTVHRSYKDLHVACQKKGFKSTEKTVKSKTTPHVFGNVIAGGVIGTSVDVLNGSAYDYPEVITLPMKS